MCTGAFAVIALLAASAAVAGISVEHDDPPPAQRARSREKIGNRSLSSAALRSGNENHIHVQFL